MVKPPKDVSELIDALGGTSAVAEMLGVGKSAVSNARRAGYLPEGWKWRLAKRCKEMAVVLPRGIFDLPPVRAESPAASNAPVSRDEAN